MARKDKAGNVAKPALRKANTANSIAKKAAVVAKHGGTQNKKATNQRRKVTVKVTVKNAKAQTAVRRRSNALSATKSMKTKKAKNSFAQCQRLTNAAIFQTSTVTPIQLYKPAVPTPIKETEGNKESPSSIVPEVGKASQLDMVEKLRKQENISRDLSMEALEEHMDKLQKLRAALREMPLQTNEMTLQQSARRLLTLEQKAMPTQQSKITQAGSVIIKKTAITKPEKNPKAADAKTQPPKEELLAKSPSDLGILDMPLRRDLKNCLHSKVLILVTSVEDISKIHKIVLQDSHSNKEVFFKQQ